jgi:uncharacterized protein YndB with AHSA1/START domain
MLKLQRLLKATLGVAIAIALLSALFPSKFGAQRSLDIAAPAEKIFPLLDDPRQWKRWAPWFEPDPATTISFSGEVRGVGARAAWMSSTEGGGSVKFERIIENQRLDYSLVFSSGTPARGYFELTPMADGKTKVLWRLEGDTGWNPLARWFGLLVDKMVGPNFEKGLAKLAKVVETTK